MLNETLLWLLLIPVVLSITTFLIFPQLANVPMQDRLLFSGGGLIISAVILTAAFYIGKGAKTADQELWNGEITKKERVHDSYTRSYDCMCTTDDKGNTTCQTCYEDHYTVEWMAYSNVGDYSIDKLDSTSRRVYNEPDNDFWKRIQLGDPVAKKNKYTNYIKAVPESLFRPASSDLKQKFAKWLPPYPISIYNFYRVDRVIPVGVNIPDIGLWNEMLSQKLKRLGPLKQVNTVIVIARTDDPNYFYALQDAWLNGKKNDVIVVIGAPDFPHKAAWVQIMALTDKELFKVQLRDDLLELNTLDAVSVIGMIEKHIASGFQRKHMADFAYLDSEIDPPTWVIVSTIIALIAAYAGFWAFVKFGNIPQFRPRRYRF
jgi:hypothetical protein